MDDGEKIEDAKSSVIRLIKDMRDDDEVSLVRYSDSASVVSPMARVGRVRDELIGKVRMINAGGGTAIPLGLSQGMATLEDAGKGRVRRVVLVSDGLDSSRAAAQRIATDSFGKGVTVSSLGIGLDFDESYMSGLSAAGHGNFGFVKNSNSLSVFLERELNETASTTIQGAKVRVKVPAGVTATRASGAEMRQIGDNEIELQLGSLFSGDERRVLVEMTAHMETDAKAFDAAASWNLVGGGPVEAGISRLTVNSTYEPTDVEASRDNEVAASAISVVASKRQLEAAEAYQRGDVLGAQNLIDNNMKDLKAAQAFAPPAAATALQKQEAAYGGTKKVFSTARPKSAEGNAAAKGVFEKDVSNMDRAAY
jgi:Ca-activated chloride channel family protein